MPTGSGFGPARARPKRHGREGPRPIVVMIVRKGGSLRANETL